MRARRQGARRHDVNGAEITGNGGPAGTDHGGRGVEEVLFVVKRGRAAAKGTVEAQQLTQVAVRERRPDLLGGGDAGAAETAEEQSQHAAEAGQLPHAGQLGARLQGHLRRQVVADRPGEWPAVARRELAAGDDLGQTRQRLEAHPGESAQGAEPAAQLDAGHVAGHDDGHRRERVRGAIGRDAP